VFDQRKFKKESNQGFLGVVNVQMSSVFDIRTDGDGTPRLSFIFLEILTLELDESNSGISFFFLIMNKANM